MKCSGKDRAMILIFVLLTCVPFLVWPLLQPALEGENTENRNLTEAPDFSLAEMADYPAKFETWLNDHMPFRSRLIQVNNAMKYHLFHVSSNENVIIGKDGWLFYAAESSPEFFNGRKRYTEEQLSLMVDNISRFSDYMKQQGIPLFLFIAPNKERVYSEYMPERYGAVAEDCALNQVLTAIRERTDVPAVCPLDAILEAKVQYPDRLSYHKTDTHWNPWGAYLGVRELLKEMRIPFDESVVWTNVIPDEPGDLANMLNLAGWIDPGTRCFAAGFELPSTIPMESDFFGTLHYVAPDAKQGRLLMYRDSFCTAMAPVLAHVFSETKMVHYQSVTPELIEAEKPDYVVVELVERTMDILLDTAKWFPAE